MIHSNATNLQTSCTILLPVEATWSLFTLPHHIMHWNQADESWFTSYAECDLRPGGRFLYRMEACDGSAGFDFCGTFTNVIPFQSIEYKLDDNRKVSVLFETQGDTTKIVELFEPELQNSHELQFQGWQAVLNNFKLYTETQNNKIVLNYKCVIAAPAHKVHEIMLGDASYRKWTSAFNPTSHFTGNWSKGSGIKFLGTSEDGSKAGMVSRIRENILAKVVSIEHLGMVVNNEEVYSGPEVDDWKGSLENYFFSEANGLTTVEIFLDGTKEFEDYFDQTWPEALLILKNLCETPSL